MWEFGYRLSDDPQRTRIFYNLMWPYIRRAIYRLLNDHPYHGVSRPSVSSQPGNEARFSTIFHGRYRYGFDSYLVV